MVMSRTDAAAVVELVASDHESTKRISSLIDGVLPDSWGLSGSIRNVGYVIGHMVTLGHWGDASEKEFADRVCTGIADATSRAINAAVAKKDPRLRRFSKAVTVDRNIKGTAHTATGLITISGAEHVFDWHQTLNEKNPMIYRTLIEWKHNSGGVTFDDFKGWDRQT